DANGDKLDGSRRYTLRFPAGEHPPARYWRVSMYDDGGFFTHNPTHRPRRGNMGQQPHGQGRRTHPTSDQPAPTGQETNWLPCPEGEFFMGLRMYQPEKRMYDGNYTVPPVTPVT